MDESYYGGSAGLIRSTSVPSVNGMMDMDHAGVGPYLFKRRQLNLLDDDFKTARKWTPDEIDEMYKRVYKAYEDKRTP